MPSVSDSLWPHGLQNPKPPSPPPSPGVCPSMCPLHRWCHPTISSSVSLFSFHLQSFPTLGSFPLTQLFISGGQNIAAPISTLDLPMSIQGWLPLGLTGLISLLSKGFLAPQFKSISSLLLCLICDPALTTVCDYWKDHRVDYMDLCWQTDVLPF